MASEQDSNFQVFVRIKPFDLPATFGKEHESCNNLAEDAGLMASLKNISVISPRSIVTNPNSTKSSTRKIYDAVKHDGQTIQLIDRDFRCIDSKERFFQFSAIFGPKASNEEIFKEAVIPKLYSVLEGVNTTIMAYGITGAGKTHTIFGDSVHCYKQKGVCTYTIEHLIHKMKELEDTKKFDMYFSYLEIYNEQAIDLLSETSKVLQVLDDSQKGVLLPGIVELKVINLEEIEHLISKGNLKRTLAPTAMNQFSSRSHAIIQLRIETRDKLGERKVYHSRLRIIDLAGSEKASIYETKSQEKNLAEGASINKSLLALGNCINILSDRTKKKQFVPFRDSKLTRLLKDSLSGGGQNIMIACITPNSLFLEETVNTLNYASRAKLIKGKLEKNFKEFESEGEQQAEIMSSMQLEIATLRDIISHQSVLCPKCSSENFILSTTSSTTSEKISLPPGPNSETFQIDAKDSKCVMIGRLQKLEEEREQIKTKILLHKGGQSKFLSLPQTQQRLAFMEKFLQVYGLNFEEQARIKQDIQELVEHLTSVKDDIDELEEQLDTDGLSPEEINQIQSELFELRNQKEENNQMKDKLENTLVVKQKASSFRYLYAQVNLDQQKTLKSKLMNSITEILLQNYKLESENFQLNGEIVELKISNLTHTIDHNSKASNIRELQTELANLRSAYQLQEHKILELELTLRQKGKEELQGPKAECLANMITDSQEEKQFNEDHKLPTVKVCKIHSPIKEKRVSTPTGEIFLNTNSKLSTRSDSQIKSKPHPNTAPMKRYADKPQLISTKQRTNSTAFCNNLVSNKSSTKVETVDSEPELFSVNESYQGNFAEIVQKNAQRNEYFNEVSPRQATSKSGQALNGKSREGTPIPNFGSEAQSVTIQRGQKIATNQGKVINARYRYQEDTAHDENQDPRANSQITQTSTDKATISFRSQNSNEIIKSIQHEQGSVLSSSVSYSKEANANSPKDCQNFKFSKKTNKDPSVKEKPTNHLQINITDISRQIKASFINPLNSVELFSAGPVDAQEANSRRSNNSHGKVGINQNLKPLMMNLIKEDARSTPLSNQSSTSNKISYSFQKFAPKKI